MALTQKKVNVFLIQLVLGVLLAVVMLGFVGPYLISANSDVAVMLGIGSVIITLFLIGNGIFGLIKKAMKMVESEEKESK